jgi:hypothetical protein
MIIIFSDFDHFCDQCLTYIRSNILSPIASFSSKFFINRNIGPQILYMLKVSGLNDLINDEDKFEWLNPSIRAGQNSDSNAREYFSQLSKSQVSILTLHRVEVPRALLFFVEQARSFNQRTHSSPPPNLETIVKCQASAFIWERARKCIHLTRLQTLNNFTIEILQLQFYNCNFTITNLQCNITSANLQV